MRSPPQDYWSSEDTQCLGTSSSNCARLGCCQGEEKERNTYLGRREVELNVLEVELGVEVLELLLVLEELVVVGVVVEEV